MSSVSLIDGHIDEPRMTDNEIIKALEWHLNGENYCDDCPLFTLKNTTTYCVDELLKSALALIKRQTAEIERLMNKLEQREEMMANLGVELTAMRSAANSYKMHYDKSQVENKRLWEERNRIYENLQETNSELEEYRKAYVKAKSEAIKEFWKKIKRVIKKHICFFTPEDESELIQYGDNLVKEMVGDVK